MGYFREIFRFARRQSLIAKSDDAAELRGIKPNLAIKKKKKKKIKFLLLIYAVCIVALIAVVPIYFFPALVSTLCVVKNLAAFVVSSTLKPATSVATFPLVLSKV